MKNNKQVIQKESYVFSSCFKHLLKPRTIDSFTLESPVNRIAPSSETMVTGWGGARKAWKVTNQSRVGKGEGGTMFEPWAEKKL